MDTINFTRGVPANESFPTTDLIDAAGAAFKTHGTAMLQYGPSRGFEPLRQWLAEWQGVAVDRVMTSNGSLQLIEFLCLQVLKPGDLVFTESPSYDRTINLLRRHGATVVGIPLEADGPNLEALEVIEPSTMQPVARDGRAIGEIMLRGNTVMKGYLKNPPATAEAFRGDWYHTGDLAVMHADGYCEVVDRSKDVIISGGENISSIEVEGALYRHPAVLEAAVVARPDPKWGESPCAFVTLKDGAEATAEDLIAHCRSLLAGFKTPKSVMFGPLPKTSTGKIQKHVLRDQARAL